VGYLLSEAGFEEDVVIAGLLHDVLEDRPEFAGEVEQFGPRVFRLVEWVSERKVDNDGNKIPWLARKVAYRRKIAGAPAEAKAICCVDKIHNMQSIVLAAERGANTWANLKATPEAQLERLSALRERLAEGWDHELLRRYDGLLSQLRELVDAGAYSV